MRRSTPERSSPANEAPKAPPLVPAPPPIERLVLDPGLDFIFHKDGMIELTEAGFRRMGQAHSAGLDTVIEIDRRYLLHFPASKPKFAGAAASWGQVERGLSILGTPLSRRPNPCPGRGSRWHGASANNSVA